ncbi:MAG: amidohydrolase family protein [Deltaproteobacteria bacterium]|nr:amidohydrolase family protein [Deltaproteobacteria bacterium]
MDETLSLFTSLMIDGSGNAAQKHMLIRVSHGRILSIRKAAVDDLRSPGCVDLRGCTVVPALIDAHVHLCMSGTSDREMREQQLKMDYDGAERVMLSHAREQLVRGVMAVRDGGDYAAHALRFKQQRCSGNPPPLRVMSAGKAWRAPGRYGKLIGRPPVEGLTLAESVARHSVGLDHVKLVNSGLNSLTHYGKQTPPQFSVGDLRAAVEAARLLGLKTMVHANGVLPVQWAVEAGCHSIEHGFFMGRENLERMVEAQTFWVPTAITMQGYSEKLEQGTVEKDVARKNLEEQVRQMAWARQLGVPLAVGTDSGSLGVHHGASLVEELKLFMEAGYTLEQSIHCATAAGALLLGLENQLGRLVPGAPATFVVAEGDRSSLPDALTTPESVYMAGSLWKDPPQDGTW